MNHTKVVTLCSILLVLRPQVSLCVYRTVENAFEMPRRRLAQQRMRANVKAKSTIITDLATTAVRCDDPPSLLKYPSQSQHSSVVSAAAAAAAPKESSKSSPPSVMPTFNALLPFFRFSSALAAAAAAAALLCVPSVRPSCAPRLPCGPRRCGGGAHLAHFSVVVVVGLIFVEREVKSRGVLAQPALQRATAIIGWKASHCHNSSTRKFLPD